MTLTDLNLSSHSWQKTIAGQQVSFYRLQMPNAVPFNGKWFAWYVSPIDHYEPKQFDTMPTQAEVEELYTV